MAWLSVNMLLLCLFNMAWLSVNMLLPCLFNIAWLSVNMLLLCLFNLCLIDPLCEEEEYMCVKLGTGNGINFKSRNSRQLYHAH